MKKQNINILKAICAYFIIIIHCNYPGKLGILAETIARFALPTFFMISGYFRFYTQDIDFDKKMTNKIMRLLKLTIIAHLVYFLLQILELYSLNNITEWISESFKIKNIIKFFIFNRSSLKYGHLWYMLALLYCYIIFRKIKTIKKEAYLYFIIICILTLTIIIEMSSQMLEINSILGIDIVLWYRNFVFIGFPFVSIGYLIHKHENEIVHKIGNKELYLSIIFGSLVAILERKYIGHYELYIGSIIMSIGIFLLFVKNDKFENIVLSEIGDKYSTGIYLYHYALIYIISIFEKKFYIFEKIKFYFYYKPIIICVLITFIVAFINFIKNIFIKKMEEK